MLLKNLKALGLATIFLTFGFESSAYVERGYEALRDSEIRCDVVSAWQMKDGEVVRSFKPNSQMKTRNQDGGTSYVDAKCFLTPVLNQEGEDSKISFGCISMEAKTVKKFSSDHLKIVRPQYHEKIEIDFKTGKGSHSFDARACDWDDCTKVSAQVEFANCEIVSN